MTKYTFALFFLLTSSIVFSQKYTIKGNIIDENKKSLEAAMIVILNAVDSTMLGFSMTNQAGEFKVADIPSGNANLQITYIGYGTIQKSLQISGDNKIIDLGNISLSQDATLLQDITISAEYIPIKITKDTIEYNADAFKVQPNASVEDLLKKLPGVEVDNAGVITVKGEEVKAITVDGKEFFGKDPKMATRNLPADAVKKVQVFDKKSKNAQFTGVEDGSEEKTINLELKADRKDGTFGNAMVGYGTDNRYETKGIINRFSSKNQWSIIGNANNLNQQGINASDFGSLATGSGSNNSSGGAPVNWGGQLPQGNIESATVGLNFNHDFTKANKFNLSYYLTKANTLLNEEINSNTFVRDSSIISHKFRNSDTKNANHSWSATTDFKIDSTSEITFSSNASYRLTDSKSNTIDTTFNQIRSLINRNIQARINDQNTFNFSSNLSFRKKFKQKGRNMTLNGQYGNNQNEALNNILSNLYNATGEPISLNTYYQLQNNLTAVNSYNIGGSYNEPITKNWTWSSSISTRNNRSDLIKDFYDIDLIDPNLQILNQELSRAFDNSYRYSFFGQTFRYVVENFSSNVGLEYQNSQLIGIPNIGERISYPFNVLLPNANAEWEKPNIRLNYNTSLREPSVDQLQPILDNSDPLNIYQGNPNLQPEYRHNGRISYNWFDQFNFRSLFINLRYTYTKDKIATATTINGFGGRTRMPVNTDYESSINSFGSFSSPINPLKAKYRVGFNNSFTRGQSLINESINDIDRVSNGVNFTLENKQKKLFDISATARWSWNNNIYRDNPSQNTAFINQTYEGNLILYPGKGWTIESRMEYYFYDQGSFSENTNVSLLTGSVSKLLFKNKWQVKLRAFDILDQNKGINRSVSESAISESVSNTIGRFFMMTLLYDIKSFGDRKSSGNEPQMHRMRM